MLSSTDREAQVKGRRSVGVWRGERVVEASRTVGVVVVVIGSTGWRY